MLLSTIVSAQTPLVAVVAVTGDGGDVVDLCSVTATAEVGGTAGVSEVSVSVSRCFVAPVVVVVGGCCAPFPLAVLGVTEAPLLLSFADCFFILMKRR